MAETKSILTDTGTIERKKVRYFFTQLFTEHPLGAFGLVVVVVFLFVGIFAESIAPYGMNETDIANRLQSPNRKYLLGSDLIGRDMFSRIIIGARTSLTIGLAATLVSVIIALILGILSAYLGGVFDLVVQRFVDAWMSIPGLILLMVMTSIFGTSIFSMVLILALRGGIGSSRMIRSTVIRIKEDVYLSAAKAIGARTSTILLRHVLPNIMAPTIVMASQSVPGFILAEAGLAFLGFGIGPPTPSWGGMLSGQVRFHMFQSPHLIIWPGVALALVVYGANMFGDAMRDILDPRLRGGAGRFNAKKTQPKPQPVKAQ